MAKLIAGNWKMNGLRTDGLVLARRIADWARAERPSAALALFPPATLIAPLADALAGSEVALGGQDCHSAAKGAHTGDIGAAMLADLGCRYVIVGHSERRQDHGETDALVAAKAKAAHQAGLIAVVCIGETEAARNAGEALSVVARQLTGSLPTGCESTNTVVAYEPVWAIGTGRTAAPDDVAEMHAAIRRQLAKQIRGGDQARILYGGSVKPDNAKSLMAVANVDGALVGGASLDAAAFIAIAEAAAERREPPAEDGDED
jgi:triosephosphate isomerase